MNEGSHDVNAVLRMKHTTTESRGTDRESTDMYRGIGGVES